MKVRGEDTIDKIKYSYTTEINQLEEENRILRETVEELKKSIDRFNEPPLLICEIKEVFEKHAILVLPNGNNFYVSLSKNCNKLKSGDSVLVDQKNLTVLKKLHTSKDFNIGKYVIIEKPKIEWKEVGGLQEQINEIKEVIELPLKNPKLFEEVGIQPPRGVLLHGPPGTGKTLLAKAVAASTNSTFIELVGSELVQKFIGEGAKLVKGVFELAKNKAPSIIFIDEIDAIAAKRIEIGTSGEREVQRTFMQLLAEIDGFKHLGDVKVIGCTNRLDTLDPAVIRPGRLDRLIEIGLPEKEGIRDIFQIHNKNMTLREVNLDKLVRGMIGFSGAEIKAACTEAGYFAIRSNRIYVTQEDFEQAIEKVRQTEEEDKKEIIKMFG